MTTPALIDARRITPDDPDVQRVHHVTIKRLRASVTRLCRDLQDGVQEAASAFVARHVAILDGAFDWGWHGGAQDYWQSVSNRPRRWGKIQANDPHMCIHQAEAKRRVLGFYAPSVAKLAVEAQQVWKAQKARRTLHEPITLSEHNGAMVGWFLDGPTARKLAIPHGEPANDLHITLAFLGDASEISSAKLKRLLPLLRQTLLGFDAFHGVIAGIGKFTNVPPGGKVPIIALVDIPGFEQLRKSVCEAVQNAGLPYSQLHGFTPHITLAYADDTADMPIDVPHLPLDIDRLTLAVGGKRTTLLIQAGPAALSEPYRFDDVTAAGDLPPDEPPPPTIDQFPQQVDVRIQLQADLSWSGWQEGYTAAGGLDGALPWIKLYWVLQPLAKHCSNCPAIAQGSPYDPPGGRYGTNILLQVPGDGRTECGAGCKCDLVYGPPDGGDGGVDWRGKLPSGMPPGGRAGPLVINPPVGRELGQAQKSALDKYREAALEWARVAHGLPALDTMFAPDGSLANLDWESLTEVQQAALIDAQGAIEDWMIADDPGAALDDGSGDAQLVEHAESYLLYNPYHLPGGGPGGGQFTGPGGGGGGGHSSGERARIAHSEIDAAHSLGDVVRAAHSYAPHITYDIRVQGTAHIEHVRSVAHQVVSLGEQYPEALRHLGIIATHTSDAARLPVQLQQLGWHPGVLGMSIRPEFGPHYGMKMNGRAMIILHEDLLKSSPGLTQIMAQQRQAGWYGPHADRPAAGIFTHEFGHVMHYYLQSTKVPQAVRDRVETWSKAGHPAPISQYARVNEREAFAEAFAAIHTLGVPRERHAGIVEMRGLLNEVWRDIHGGTA